MNRAQKLQQIYDDLPGIDCQGHCWDSCGPIDMTGYERERIAREGGVEIARGSWLADGPGMCPALTPFRQCSVYELRPLICRIWGLTKELPCTYGCRPERYLSDVEAGEFMARVHEVAGEHEDARLVRLAMSPEYRERWRAAKLEIRDRTDVELYRQRGSITR